MNCSVCGKTATGYCALEVLAFCDEHKQEFGTCPFCRATLVSLPVEETRSAKSQTSTRSASIDVKS